MLDGMLMTVAAFLPACNGCSTRVLTLPKGFFHADPHPGNMLRTPDGQLVILDFGLMTEVTSHRSIAAMLVQGCPSLGHWCSWGASVCVCDL